MTHAKPVARPPRRRLPPDDRRDALIAAALDLFNNSLYDDVSVDGLAAAAGASRTLIYHYFGGKTGLFVAAVRQAGDQLLTAIDAAAAADPDNWLNGCIEAFLGSVDANPLGLTTLLRRGSLPGGADRQILDEIRAKILKRILAVLDPPTDSAVLRAVLLGWIAMTETLCTQWLQDQQPTRSQLRTLLPELLRATLAAAAWHDPSVAAVLSKIPR
ncbi:MAG TPA: TetR/AcrR family transcriptional regulator [Micromonosporaceae bacterium]|nr:TetR/AcrR family transcriptional regulator [Micromonosporaceae bacterium]HCU51333.1 TetR/AcrR family transcriptional regulator [Micromonosporaceae bacterium]